MAQFSLSSAQKLSTCHSDLQIICKRLIERYDFSVICGYRDEQAQNKAYNEGNSKLRYPDSKHNTSPSLAVDLAPYEKTGIDWSKLQSAYFAGQVVALAEELFAQGIMKHKIRCGIDFDMDNDIDDSKFFDAGHFELRAN
jgi:peptidoglycan LD-endopeptidase CwlK